ncbi:hypothetical protein BJV74DRAFT_989254, partial [Russula compacta]
MASDAFVRYEGQDFENFAEKLFPATRVSVAFNHQSEASTPLYDVVVQLPIPHGSAMVASDSDTFVDSNLIKGCEVFFINVQRWEPLGVPISDRMLYVYHVIRQFQTTPQSWNRSCNASRVLHLMGMRLSKLSNVKFLDAYFHRKGTIEDGSTEEFTFEREFHDEPPRRNATKDQLIDLSYIASRNWERIWNGEFGNNLNEPLMSGVFFQYLVQEPASQTTARMYALNSFPLCYNLSS